MNSVPRSGLILAALMGALLLSLMGAVGEVAGSVTESTLVSVKLSLAKTVYGVGEEPTGTITLTNTSKQPWFILPLTFRQTGFGGYLGVNVKGPVNGATRQTAVLDSYFFPPKPTLVEKIDEFGMRVMPEDFYGGTREIPLKFQKPGVYSVEIEYQGLLGSEDSIKELTKSGRIALQGVYRSPPVSIRVVRD